ncbi:hypothetical protein SAMN04488089_110122 [Myroides profundi]|uniref:Glycosyl-4,4'-diaponeurosporenoate acyltransferase n=2 Tax=Myroides profundi TaxID=480520 RepID=A0AAJ5BEL3_MYRPR|nr:hypothetical protein MPR_1234 [Myroides profundi]SER18712.1 hypothetical protein SAMN04488089_110122 [Myroides profundi]
MLFTYLSFSISIIFISFIVGMIMTTLIRKTEFYSKKLSNLNFVKNEMTNKILGVEVIKWMIKNTFFKFLNPKLKFDKKMNISDVKTIRKEMTKAEIDHLFALIFVSVIIIWKIYNQEYLLAFIIFLINIVMNLLPSLLQQQNKRRIDKLILKFETN